MVIFAVVFVFVCPIEENGNSYFFPFPTIHSLPARIQCFSLEYISTLQMAVSASTLSPHQWTVRVKVTVIMTWFCMRVTVKVTVGVMMAKRMMTSSMSQQLRKHPEVCEKRDTGPHDTLILWPVRIKHWNDKHWQSSDVPGYKVTLRKSLLEAWSRLVYHVALASRLHAPKYQKKLHYRHLRYYGGGGGGI